MHGKAIETYKKCLDLLTETDFQLVSHQARDMIFRLGIAYKNSQDIEEAIKVYCGLNLAFGAICEKQSR
jgi:hypothetical protein